MRRVDCPDQGNGIGKADSEFPLEHSMVAMGVIVKSSLRRTT
jgi:hypothetical protein